VSSPYVCLVAARLHFGDSHDLKGKRKLLQSLKAHLRRDFGAAVASRSMTSVPEHAPGVIVEAR